MIKVRIALGEFKYREQEGYFSKIRATTDTTGQPLMVRQRQSERPESSTLNGSEGMKPESSTLNGKPVSEGDLNGGTQRRRNS